MPDTFTSRIDSELIDKQFTRADESNDFKEYDGAAPRVLKELHEIITEPLNLIFGQSLDLGKLPVGWKIKLVSLISRRLAQTPSHKLQISRPNINHL